MGALGHPALTRRAGLAGRLLPALALLGAGYVAPLATVAWTSLHRAGGLTLTAYRETLASPVFLDILWRTARIAGSVTLICLLLAYPFAYWTVTRAGRRAGVILATVGVPYLTSVLIRSYAWVAILGGGGPVVAALRALLPGQDPPTLVFNTFGTYVGMVHILLPMAVLPVYASLRRVDPALLLAARNLGGSPAVAFRDVTLPLSLPGLRAAACLVFLSALGFYVTPVLLGEPGDYMIAQAIEVRISRLAEFDVAAAQACMLLLATGALLVLFRRQIAASAQDGGVIAAVGGGDGLRRARSVPGMKLAGVAVEALAPLAPPLLWTLSIALLLFLLAPMVVVVLIAFSSAPYLTFPPPGFSVRWFAALLTDRAWLGSAGFSLAVSAAAAVTAVAAVTPLAAVLARRRFRGRGLVFVLAISPMVLPHVVLGLGLLFTLVALGLNGSPAGFWLAYAAIGVPYAVVILLPAFAQLDPNVGRAAASLGGAPVTVFRTVTLPLLAVSFASAFLFAFLAGFDDLIISLFLSSPRHTTLAMRMWEDIQLEISPKTAVVGAVQLAVLAFSCATAMIARVRRRPGIAGG